ncbi:hypothetical protein [Streptacidiphilus monticola]|uniref:Uncharacterized protein n=1 Tax=Streptacidiphilus monticola TaxID=2161674 RepID=A0ABW1G0U9_9ACTN
MITSWLYRTLPGPAWLRLAVLLTAAALLAWVLWEWGFAWAMREWGAPLEGDPVIGG